MVTSLIFIIWSLIIYAISYFGFLTLPHSGKFDNDFFKSFTNWDGGHYLSIAQAGYGEKFQYAFFPLYPIIIGFVNQFIQNYTLSAVLISVVSALVAINVFYRLVSLDFSKKLAENATFWLLIFPTSFYFLTAYSEGLFFLLVILTFFFLRKGNLFLAMSFAALASATRLAGLGVVLALLVDVQLTQGIGRKNWYVLLSPLGLLIYCWYLFNNTGDPFYFITAEKYWQRGLAPPTVGFWEAIKGVTSSGLAVHNLNAVLELLFAIFGTGMAIRSFRFLSPAFGVYSLVSIALPLLTSTLASMPRFLLPIFPIFILLAILKNKYLIFFYKVFSISLLALFSVLFINGYWVS